MFYRGEGVTGSKFTMICASCEILKGKQQVKTNCLSELRLNTTAALFDDEDFLVEPVELSSVFNALSSDGTATDDVTSVDATSSSDTALIDGTTTDDATATDDALTETTSTGSADAQGNHGPVYLYELGVVLTPKFSAFLDMFSCLFSCPEYDHFWVFG